MPEREQIRITPVTGRKVLRLKSWLAAQTREGTPVILAGQNLPSEIGMISAGPARALCVGPGEWLMMSDKRESSNMRAHIAPEAFEQGLAVVDLTEGLAGIEVSGSAARDLLSKGCGLDLHPGSFPAGRCARTRFAQIPLVLECLDEPSRFELHVARSHFHYLHSWLIDAAV